jgi:hypothetical protein
MMKTKKLLIVALIAFSGAMISHSAKAQATSYFIQFYDDDNFDKSHPTLGYGSNPGNGLCYNQSYQVAKNVLTKTNQRLNCNTHQSANDRARACSVTTNGPATFIIYDSPDGKTNDDYLVITVKTAVTDYYLSNLEMNFHNDPVIDLTYHPDNGLNGKVSSFIIQ